MVTSAGSGHPGGSMSSADFLTALFFDVMKHDPASWTRDGKGQDFSPLREPLRSHAAFVALIGKDREKIREALADAVPTEEFSTLEEAVDALWARAVKTGGVLLLSPACASWDMFRDYAERSARFIAAARRAAGGV